MIENQWPVKERGRTKERERFELILQIYLTLISNRQDYAKLGAFQIKLITEDVDELMKNWAEEQ